MNDPHPIIEPDTLRGARSVPLAPVITRERPRTTTPWRNNGGDAATTSDYYHDPNGNPRRVTTTPDIDHYQEKQPWPPEPVTDIASRHGIHRETVRRILNNEHQDQP